MDIFEIRVRGEKDVERVIAVFAHPAHKLDAASGRHFDVADHDIDRLRLIDALRLHHAVGDGYLADAQRIPTDGAAQPVQGDVFVINQEKMVHSSLL